MGPSIEYGYFSQNSLDVLDPKKTILQEVEGRVPNASLGFLPTGVKNQVKRFLSICYVAQEAKHSPNRLRVRWGVVDFVGMMESVSVNYSLFDQEGNPLRAELEVI